MEMDNIRHQYPALENFSYFNSCSSGLFSKTLVAYRRQLDEGFQERASLFRDDVYDEMNEIKATVANVFGAHVDRTALIPSCSHGINMVLEAMEKDKRVLHFDYDFPSIVWPYDSRGFEMISIPNKAYTAEELIDHIQANQINILAVSAVQYSNGEIIAPQTFRAIKEQCPEILLMVDATQFFGICSFNFQESGIDLFVTSAFKWLCAGYGSGVMFISEQLEPMLSSKARGYNTYKNAGMRGEPSIGEFFEPGHQDLVAFRSLEFQVKEHSKIGFDNIQDQINKVKTYARERIANETAFDVITSLNPHLESGILSVDAPKEMVQHLKQHQVVCSYRKGLRLGIHFYNNLEDVDLLVESMKTFS